MLLKTFLLFSGILIGYGSSTKIIDIFNQKYGDIYELRNVYNDPSNPNVQRNALKPNSDKKWDKLNAEKSHYVIPYTIKGTFNKTERKVVRRAMDAIEENTCVVFKPRDEEEDYVQFENTFDEGCYSMVGKEGGPQTIMLESNTYQTCIAFEIVVHELLHTVGLWHEQMRVDRDSYIKVHYENIDRRMYPQFKKVTTDEATTYNVPYNYKSVMHYGKNAFARGPGLVTMETIDPVYQEVIGNVKEVAAGDYQKVCLIYNCQSCMGNSNWKNNLVTKAVTKSEKTKVTKNSKKTAETTSKAPDTNKPDENDGCSDLFPTVCKSLLGDSKEPKTICKMFGPIMDSWCCKSCKIIQSK
uniref:Metalloendopeptidase n=1 Tax=Parastrongyloides trichosuri TaxID=131310 RepID=A0A0N4Z264_PARTI